MKIYTKTGDKGTSGLYNGERRDKDDPVFQALGTVDELNGTLALAYEFAKDGEVKQWIETISSCLFDVGGAIATPRKTTDSQVRLEYTKFDATNVDWLESKIDFMDTKVKPLQKFILPCGGGLASSQLQFSRTVARKAERDVWPLIRQEQVDPAVGQYLNRLSDFLFTLARYLAMQEGKKQRIYKNANARDESGEEDD